jgi:hypothetical protein
VFVKVAMETIKIRKKKERLIQTQREPDFDRGQGHMHQYQVPVVPKLRSTLL